MHHTNKKQKNKVFTCNFYVNNIGILNNKIPDHLICKRLFSILIVLSYNFYVNNFVELSARWCSIQNIAVLIIVSLQMSVVVFSHYIYVYHKCSQRLFPEASFNASKNDILINKHMINMKLNSGTDTKSI